MRMVIDSEKMIAERELERLTASLALSLSNVRPSDEGVEVLFVVTQDFDVCVIGVRV